MLLVSMGREVDEANRKEGGRVVDMEYRCVCVYVDKCWLDDSPMDTDS